MAEKATMTARERRLGRLLGWVRQQEKYEEGELRRAQEACWAIERRMAAKEAETIYGEKETAAVRGHRERYVRWQKQEWESLVEELEEARRMVANKRVSLMEVRRRRRALERLCERVAEEAERRQAAYEQLLVEAFAQRRGRREGYA